MNTLSFASSALPLLRRCLLGPAMALLLPITMGASDSVVAFGLTFVAKEGTTLTLDNNGYPTAMPASRLAQRYGVTIQLGKADSGVFGYPNTDYSNEDYAMSGTAYGSVNGITNHAISTVRGITTSYGVYSVTADFRPLGGYSQTYILFNGNKRVAQTTGGMDVVIVDCYNCWPTPTLPRVNPFWRMPDGSIGALIELDETAHVTLPGKTDAEWTCGNRIFIRANQATHAVDYVSQVDVSASSSLSNFYFSDARLGVFQHPHKALGQAVFSSRSGGLVVGNLDARPEYCESLNGVAVELNEPKAFAGTAEIEPGDGAGHFSMALVPLSLDTEGSELCLSALASINRGESSLAGSAQLLNHEDSLQLAARLPGDRIGLAVFLHGHKVGEHVLPASPCTINLATKPLVVGAQAQAAGPNAPAGYAFRFDRPTTFTTATGVNLEGDEVRVQILRTVRDLQDQLIATNAVPVANLQTLLLTTARISSLTITEENLWPVEVPRIRLFRGGTTLIVSWNDPNQMFMVEAAPSVRGPFTALNHSFNELDQTCSAVVDLTQVNHPRLFFRLRIIPADWD